MGSTTETALVSPAAESFSLTKGGMFYRLETRLHITGDERARDAVRAFGAAVLTWLPLLLLSAAQGLAVGTQVRIPFLFDFAANVRFLVAVPLLIISEYGIDHGLRTAVRHFVGSGLVPERELPAFESVIHGVSRLRDRTLPELVLLALAFLSSLSIHSQELLMVSRSAWYSVPVAGGRVLSYAGWWFDLVSAPLFRFLILRWLWRMILWSWFLWRVSKLKLALIPTHADRTAGLGFLAEAQLKFGWIAFAGSAVMSAQAANALAYRGATMAQLKYVLATYCIVVLILLIAPLVLLTPTLVRVKKRGLLEYAALATAYVQSFDAKWVHAPYPPRESLLGGSDIQSLADLNSSYAIVREMRVVPIDKATLIGLVVAALLPMVPLLLAVASVDELVRDVLHLLL
jgi:hypothetical protein